MFPHLQCSVMAPKNVLWHPPILWSDHCYLKENGLLHTAVSKVTKPRVTEWGSNIFMSMSYIKHWNIPGRPSTHKLSELPLAYLSNQIDLSYQAMKTKVFIYGSSVYWLHSPIIIYVYIIIIYMYIHMYVCVNVCMYVCVCIYIYICYQGSLWFTW